MSRRVLFGFIFLNVLVTGAVLLLAWTFWLGPRNEQRTPVMGPTQIVILTATPAPGFDIKPADYQATIAALEAALDARAAAPPAAGVTPTGAGDVTESADSAGETAIPTLNPACCRLPSACRLARIRWWRRVGEMTAASATWLKRARSFRLSRRITACCPATCWRRTVWSRTTSCTSATC